MLYLHRGTVSGARLVVLLFQGTAADRFLRGLSSFVSGLDTKNNVKVCVFYVLCGEFGV